MFVECTKTYVRAAQQQHGREGPMFMYSVSSAHSRSIQVSRERIQPCNSSQAPRSQNTFLNLICYQMHHHRICVRVRRCVVAVVRDDCAASNHVIHIPSIS